jgi:hypothetical protein
MDRDGQVRKEPTLADLEAFEQLLRDSLQGGPSAPEHPKVSASPAPEPPPRPDAVALEPAYHPDQAAMAELARLIESPVDLGFTPTPDRVQPQPKPRNDVPQDYEAQDYRAVSQTSQYPEPAHNPDPAHHPEPTHTHGSAHASMSETWAVQPSITTQFAAAAGAAAAHAPESPPLDPLAAFEEELRRFDAIRLAEQHAADAAASSAELRPAYPAEAAYGHDDQPEWQHGGAASQPMESVSGPAYAVPSPAEASLHAAEARLATQAAAAAAAAGGMRSNGRSKGIFLAMGGIALAGLAVVGGSFVFGSGSKGGKSGTVPVIAAKTEPTKQKPADPGGLEIPNQNKEVLAARTQAAVKPANVVNSTEQPLDLNQVTKRDPVRVVAPNPYQSGAPTADTAQAGSGATTPADATRQPIEPRRVSSVRIPVPGQATLPAVGAVALAGGSVAGGGANAAALPGTAAPANAAPVSAPVPPLRVPTPVSAPVKVESRPVTASAAQPRTETPRVAPPKVTAPPKLATAPKAPPRAAPHAPLSLAPPKRAASTGSGWAIQLASRPSEADAKTASTRLKKQYASTLGSRNPVVVSGQANGKTVYRIRVAGYDQAGASEACKKIKTAGGGCFITRQ